MSDRKSEVKESLLSVKTTLHSIFSKFKLHSEELKVGTESEISSFWASIIAFDATIEEGGVFPKETICDHKLVCDFLTHCCQESHTFDILECRESSCTLCKPPHLPLSLFSTLKHIPHPTPMEDMHYFPFCEAFYMTTTEEHRPSYKAPKKVKKKRKLPYYATVQHVKNAGIMVQCSECNMWRLVFSRSKLTSVHLNLPEDIKM